MLVQLGTLWSVGASIWEQWNGKRVPYIYIYITAYVVHRSTAFARIGRANNARCCRAPGCNRKQLYLCIETNINVLTPHPPDALRRPLRDLYCAQLPVCNDVSGFTVAIATRQKGLVRARSRSDSFKGTWCSTPTTSLLKSVLYA